MAAVCCRFGVLAGSQPQFKSAGPRASRLISLSRVRSTAPDWRRRFRPAEWPRFPDPPTGFTPQQPFKHTALFWSQLLLNALPRFSQLLLQLRLHRIPQTANPFLAFANVLLDPCPLFRSQFEFPCGPQEKLHPTLFQPAL
jgi:hypothetical protein